MQTRKPVLLLRLYGSIEAAKRALTEKARERDLRAKAREAARGYIRGRAPAELFGRQASEEG